MTVQITQVFLKFYDITRDVNIFEGNTPHIIPIITLSSSQTFR